MKNSDLNANKNSSSEITIKNGSEKESPEIKSPALTENDRILLKKFIRGEITFAQLEGMTADDALVLAETGHRLFSAGRLRDARTIFEGLAAVNHLDPYPRQVLGAICEREDNPAQAVSHYDICLTLNQNNPWVLARRGEIRVKTGDVPGGVDDLAKACKLDPETKLPTTVRAQIILSNFVASVDTNPDGSIRARA